VYLRYSKASCGEVMIVFMEVGGWMMGAEIDIVRTTSRVGT
jgi:hypothetical protein